MWQNGADWEWTVSCRMGVCSNKKLRIDNNNSGSYHGRQQRSSNPRAIRKARLLLRSLCPIHRGVGTPRPTTRVNVALRKDLVRLDRR